MLDRRAFVGLSAALASGLTTTRAFAADAETVHVVTVDGKTSRFLPETLKIKLGDVVEWRNTSFVLHSVDFDPALSKKPGNVVLPKGVAPFTSGMMDEDATYRHKFDVAGEYKYICKYHELMGMCGALVVT
jgi:plastocyanin